MAIPQTVASHPVLWAVALSLAYLLSLEWVWPIVYRIRSRRWNTAVPANRTSHPLGIPLIRKFLNAQKNHQLLQVVRAEYAEDNTHTYYRQVLADNQWVTNHPENIKAVLSTSFKDYSLEMRHKALGPVFGDGIFTLSGEGWKHSRAMLRPQFARDQISRLDQISLYANELLEIIVAAQSRTGVAVDMQEYFHLFSMDSSTEMLFGESVKSMAAIASNCDTGITTQSGEIIKTADFIDSYTFLKENGMQRTLYNRASRLKNSKEFLFHRERARKLIDHFVAIALEATATPEAVAKLDPEHYVFSYELAKITRDPVVIRDQIFNILIAGRDTTASTLSFAVYYLAKHPVIFDKLRSEVLEEYGTAEHPKPITFEMLKRSKYLNAVLNETLRLAPAVPMNSRTVVRDTVLPVGGGPNCDQPVLVTKGNKVLYSVFLMHRDPRIWGKDAGDFIPERWLEQRLPSHPWGYLPFNGGPRICLGQQFALTEMALTLVRLLQRFSRIQPGPNFPLDEPRFDIGLTLIQNGGIRVYFE